MHTDKIYSSYAFSWVTGEEFFMHDQSSENTPLAEMTTRSGQKPSRVLKTKPLSKPIPSIANPSFKNYGGNYVDISLRVIVPQAIGTLQFFDPTHPHATTVLTGEHTTRGCTITFSTRLKKAFDKAQKGITVTTRNGLI